MLDACLEMGMLTKSEPYEVITVGSLWRYPPNIINLLLIIDVN